MSATSPGRSRRNRRMAAAGTLTCAAALIVSAATSLSATASADPAARLARGTVLIANYYGASVVAVAPDGTQSTVSTDLALPGGIAVDAAGDVLIADAGHSRVVKVTPDGTQTTLDVALTYPSGVAVDAADNVLIADSGGNQVLKVTPDGTQSVVGTGLSNPIAVAADANGDVLIADTNNNRVLRVAPDGTQSTIAAGLSSPQGVTADADGNVLIADCANNRVVKVAPDGTQTTMDVDVNQPVGITVDPAGDVLIGDFGHNRVLKVAPDGTQSTVGTNLGTPTGVAVVPGLPQTIHYTSTAPTHATIGDNYTVTATGGGSGNPVTFTRNATSAGNCTVVNDADNGATVAFTGHGYCAVFAHQAGNAEYAPAGAQVRQLIYVYKHPQTITYTSVPPARAYVGGPDYTVTATGGASGNPVTFTRTTASAAVCTVTNDAPNSATVTFTAPGSCNLHAHQQSTALYASAPTVRQHIHVYPAA